METQIKSTSTQQTAIKKPAPSYFIKLRSDHLPFTIGNINFKEIDKANEILQNFVRLIEKKFDTVWYIGTDLFGNELYERFMFQHGGFMEISIHGEIRCYFLENKTEKMRKALQYALSKTTAPSTAILVIRNITSGQRLISLQDSILK